MYGKQLQVVSWEYNYILILQLRGKKQNILAKAIATQRTIIIITIKGEETKHSSKGNFWGDTLCTISSHSYIW